MKTRLVLEHVTAINQSDHINVNLHYVASPSCV